MKVLLTIWISAVLLQEVVPSTLVRYPRQATNTPSFLHTEYEAKIEQKGKHGNESFGTLSGKQAIEHDNCNDDWNAFANKCAALIKDLVASLANAVSSKPGDATNLQLHIKNTFRHLDNTHNCSCLNHTGKRLSDIDLSHILDNLTFSTNGPVGDSHDDGLEKHLSKSGANSHPKKLVTGTNVNPEHEEDPYSTSNSRRQTPHEPHHHPSTAKTNDIVVQIPQGHKNAFHPFLTTPLPSVERSASDKTPPLYYTNKHSPPETSSSIVDDSVQLSKSGSSHHPELTPTKEVPVEIEPALTVSSEESHKPLKKTEDVATPIIVEDKTPIPAETVSDQNPKTSSESTEDNPQVKPIIDLEPENDSDERSDSHEHKTRTRPKHDDDSSNESQDRDTPTKAPEPSIPALGVVSTDKIPVTNTHSNIPESSDLTTSHISLPNGSVSPSSDENLSTEDVVIKSVTENTADFEQTTPPCDETEPETVHANLSESSSVEGTEEEVLITPKPIIGVEIPVAEDKKIIQVAPEGSEDPEPTTEAQISEVAVPVPSSGTEEEFDTTPEPVYSSHVHAAAVEPVGVALPQTSEQPEPGDTTPVTENVEIEKPAVAIVPVKPSVTTYQEPLEKVEEVHTKVKPSLILPTEDVIPEVSEKPVVVQPTTFQTTSENPTHSPVSVHPPPIFIPITTVSTPLDSDEGIKSKSKHDDDDDDDDDCCSCESCTEEEESDPKKVRDNVCRSLEEARKELKAIFDKIKKKLRCCRKMPQVIMTSSSPHPH